MKLTKTEALIAGAFLAAIEAVQINVSIASKWHAAISMFITIFVGVGIVPVTGRAFISHLSAAIVALISGLLGALLILQQTFAIGPIWHTVIAVVIVVATALGFAPTYVPTGGGLREAGV